MSSSVPRDFAMMVALSLCGKSSIQPKAMQTMTRVN
jgi:hypothetical protein